jgi:hypothetical protein
MKSIKRLFSLRVLMFAIVMAAIPAASHAQIRVGLSITLAPPILPVYEQPVCPGDGYIWTPGYWAYGDTDYYWVPGTWILAPQVGFLWTPGYWGWGGGVYLWHAGYWGPHVGFYGGVNYGFGYGGVGFEGGYWNHGVFAYNRSVTNVNVTVIHNTYNKTVVVNNTTVDRTSFNGGTGGIQAQPTASEQAAANEHHIGPTSGQVQQEHLASTNKAQFASVNHGNPGVAGTAKPGAFTGSGVVGAKGATGGPTNGGNAGNGTMRNDRPPSGGAAGTTAGTTTGGLKNSGTPAAGSGAPKTTTTGTSNGTKPPTTTNGTANTGKPSGTANGGKPSGGKPPKPEDKKTPPKGGNGKDDKGGHE